MLIVHVALTPLAGAPIRIVDALNKYTDFEARFINYSPNCCGNRTFPEDLVWEKDKDECLEYISSADILHFHHFIDLDSDNNPFLINFRKINPKAKFIRHFHTDLNYIVENTVKTKKDIINDKYPKLVIPHYPERTFLDTYIVPNIIPINDEILKPASVQNEAIKVFFSASIDTSMWHTRWNTKGLPEVQDKLSKLNKNSNFDFQIVTNTPYIECQKLKQQSDIVIGDTTSGSYHLTDLEALSMGKPTFSYLDNRTQLVLQNLLQCDELPFINTRLEEIDLPFFEIVKNEQLRKELGQFSRSWIEKYYDDRKLINHFIDVYQKLLNDEPIKRELEFPLVKNFLYNDLYDMQWSTRKQLYKKEKRSWWRKG